MENSGWARRIALCAGGLAIVGMGLTAGCSAKESPAPSNSPAPSGMDSKISRTNGPGSFAPSNTAKQAPTALPGNVNTGP